MPLYEYQCTSCSHTLELLQRMSDAPEKHCPKCNKATLSRLVSATNFKLTGTGWYETDFKHGTNASGADANTQNDSVKQETVTNAEGKAASDTKDTGSGKGSDDASSTKNSNDVPSASSSK